MGAQVKRIIVFAFIVCWGYTSFAQIGGRHSYEFLSLPASSRISALGSSVIGVMDDDVNLAVSNPANLNPKMNNSIAFNQNIHFADIKNGHLAYGRFLKGLGLSTHASWSYVDYGDFIAANDYGNQEGNFVANENAIVIGASKHLFNKINIGLNLKTIFSNFETYKSTGIAIDAGLNYIAVQDKTVVSFAIKNLGTELNTFHTTRYYAPLDIQIGISNRLKYLPFRYSIIAHQLQNWDIRYFDPNVVNTNIFGGDTSPSNFNQAVDNFFRHFIFSGEFLLGKKENLRLRVGYNHLRRKELSLSDFRSLAGYSLGFGVKIYKFRLDYGVGYHHLAGAVNHISIQTNLSEFIKSKKVE